MTFVAVLDQQRADMLFKIGYIRRAGSLCHCRKQRGDENLAGRFDGVVTKEGHVLFQQGMVFEIASIPCGRELFCQSGHSARFKCVSRAVNHLEDYVATTTGMRRKSDDSSRFDRDFRQDFQLKPARFRCCFPRLNYEAREPGFQSA